MATSSTAEKQEQIDLSLLSIEQLLQIKQDFEQEVNHIQDSLQTLYNCKAKFATSKDSLEALQADWNDRPILVPLTSSMYVPGRIKDADNYIIDIGTGYYIEKNLDGSKDYFKRRVEYVQTQIEEIEKVQAQKTRFLNAIVGVLEMKQMATAKLLQQQQQAV